MLPYFLPLDVGTVRARPAAGGSRTARARVAVADLVPSPPNVPAAAASPTAASAQPLVTIDVDAAGVATRDVATACNLRFRSDAGRVTECLSAVFRQPASPLELHGDAAPTVMAVRLETDGDVPGLSAVSGRLRFDDSALFSDGPTGALGSLPPTVVGCLDVERGYDLVGAVQPVAVDASGHVCGAPVRNRGGDGAGAGPHERAPRRAGRGEVDRDGGPGWRQRRPSRRWRQQGRWRRGGRGRSCGRPRRRRSRRGRRRHWQRRRSHPPSDHLRRRGGARLPPVLFDKQFLLSADADWTWDAAAGVFTLYVSRKVAAPAAGDSALSASGGLCVVETGNQSGDRRRRDAGGVLQHFGRRSGDGSSVQFVSGGFPSPGSDFEGRCLA